MVWFIIWMLLVHDLPEEHPFISKEVIKKLMGNWCMFWSGKGIHFGNQNFWWDEEKRRRRTFTATAKVTIITSNPIISFHLRTFNAQGYALMSTDAHHDALRLRQLLGSLCACHWGSNIFLGSPWIWYLQGKNTDFSAKLHISNCN